MMPLGHLTGVGPDDVVESTGGSAEVRRVAGASRPGGRWARPSARRGRHRGGRSVPVDRDPPNPAASPPDRSGVLHRRACVRRCSRSGRGSAWACSRGRAGKSTLLGAIARGAAADVVVVALVGERGREAAEFLTARSEQKGARGASWSLRRATCASVGEAARGTGGDGARRGVSRRGARVLLLVDSLRFARAQREIGLAAGELPARRIPAERLRDKLPRLLERSGQGEKGSITAILHVVLVEGGDMSNT